MDVLDVMDVMDVSNAHILAKNEDIATKLSEYDPWCLYSTVPLLGSSQDPYSK